MVGDWFSSKVVGDGCERSTEGPPVLALESLSLTYMESGRRPLLPPWAWTVFGVRLRSLTLEGDPWLITLLSSDFLGRFKGLRHLRLDISLLVTDASEVGRAREAELVKALRLNLRTMGHQLSIFHFQVGGSTRFRNLDGQKARMEDDLLGQVSCYLFHVKTLGTSKVSAPRMTRCPHLRTRPGRLASQNFFGICQLSPSAATRLLFPLSHKHDL